MDACNVASLSPGFLLPCWLFVAAGLGRDGDGGDDPVGICDPGFDIAPCGLGDAVAGCGGRRVSMIGLEQMGKAEVQLVALCLVPVARGRSRRSRRSMLSRTKAAASARVCLPVIDQWRATKLTRMNHRDVPPLSSAQQQEVLMGLLDSILGGNQTRTGGGTSPMTLALLALLAYRTYQGKGRLADMRRNAGANTGGVDQGGRVGGPGRLPDGNQAGPLGSGGGGLGQILGDLLRGGPGARPARPGGAGGAATGGGLGDLLRGGLGGLLGGAAAGTLLNGGLGDLLGRLQQSGYGDTANSWVGHGPNREIAPNELEDALGRDTLESLSNETDKPYNEVLSELSQSLPDTVDQLTPQGRVPTDTEAAQWL
jgi:uncharacterized protein YidB (DUF937 family)